MGCTESAAADGKNKKGARRSSAPPMTKTEIHKRIESIDETRRIKFGGVSVRYAYLSQRGYYPDGECRGGVGRGAARCSPRLDVRFFLAV